MKGIKIEPEPKEWINLGYPLEECIFFATPTIYCNIASNRPVCKVCSQIWNYSHILSAPYNY